MKLTEKSSAREERTLALAAKLADMDIVHGHVHIRVFDKEDKTLEEFSEENTITAAGLAGIIDNLLASPAGGKPTHMAVGTGSPAANALGTESDRIALTSKTSDTVDTLTMVATWDPGDVTANVTELGIFDASSSGNMWSSKTQSPAIPLGASVGMTVTWTWQVS